MGARVVVTLVVTVVVTVLAARAAREAAVTAVVEATGAAVTAVDQAGIRVPRRPPRSSVGKLALAHRYADHIWTPHTHAAPD